MKQQKVIYYTDELNDDFAATNGRIEARAIGDEYDYRPSSPIWKAASFVLYRLVATPVAYVYCKLRFGLRIKNRRALRHLRGGCFLYGNHTQSAADAYIPSLLTFPKKTSVVVSPQAVSIPFVGGIVPMLGGLPLASTIRGKMNFYMALKAKCAAGEAVTIYPEAHIWPYYNGIRPFPDGSFAYPMKLGVPAVGFAVSYRRRKVFKKAHPLITVCVSEPVYPADCADRREMRDKIFDFMSDAVEREKSCAYKLYIRKVEDE